MFFVTHCGTRRDDFGTILDDKIDVRHFGPDREAQVTDTSTDVDYL